MRRKTNGAWFVHWGGKDHYLSKNRDQAELFWFDPNSRHPGSRVAWLRWRTARRHALEATDLSASRPMLVVDVARELLEHYERAGRPGAAHYFRTHLARFLRAMGTQPLLWMAAADPSAEIGRAHV